MISSEVQRTLVKSPPELWAELSDPEALARHLGELGEIRITRSEPEKRVEWEAERTSGVVQIKPSGWGTKVTLSVTRELEAEQADATEQDEIALEAEPEAQPSAHVADPVVEPEARAAESEHAETPAIEPERLAPLDESAAAERGTVADLPMPADETEADAAPETAPQRSTEPRRGFFARLFGRRRAHASEQPPPPREPAANTEDETQAPPASSAIELLQARFAPIEPAADPPAEQPEIASEPVAEEATPVPGADAPITEAEEESVDIAAELAAAEEVAAEEVKAVLTAVLDRLGAAHHRPFSRS